MRWSEEDLAAYNARKLQGVSGVPRAAPLLEARRTGPYWPYRSKTESRYAAVLAAQLQQGLITYWSYEPIRLRLAPATTLTVDFLVQMASFQNTVLHFHEVKGRWYREDGWQKLKIAAALYPMFRFFRVQWKNNGWQYVEVPSA